MNLRQSAARAGRSWLIQAAAVVVLLGVCALAVVHGTPLLLGAGALAVLGALLAVRYPIRALASLPVLRILLDVLWWIPVTLAGLRMGPVVTGVATVALGGLVASEVRRVEGNPLARATLLLLVLTLFGAVRAPDPMVAVDLVIRIASPLLLANLVASMLPRGRMGFVFVLAPTLALAILVAISTSYWIRGDLVVTPQGIRVLGAFENFRQHGMVMAMAACLGFFWTFYARRRWARALAIVMLAAASGVMVMTLIRGAVLSLITFGLVFLLLTRRWTILAIIGLVVLISVVSIAEVRDRYDDLWLVFTVAEEDLVNVDEIGSGRYGIWRHSLAAFAERSVWDLLLGCGLGGHWELTRTAFHAQYETRGGTVDTHNDHLWLLYQLGPAGLLAYVYLVLRCFVAGLRLLRRGVGRFQREFGAGIAALSIVVLVANALSNGFLIRTSIAWLYWSLAGAALAMESWLPATVGTDSEGGSDVDEASVAKIDGAEAGPS